MNILCSQCGAALEAPDDFAEPTIVCLNCGTESAVSLPAAEAEGEVPAETEAEDAAPAPMRTGPISPQEFRAVSEGKQIKSRLVTMITVFVLLGAGAGAFFYFVPLSEVMEMVGSFNDKRMRGKIYEAAGLAPVRHYQATSLPGLRGQTGSEGGWDIQEEGKTYLVVELDAAPRHFKPSDETFKKFKDEGEFRKERDPDYEIPPRERCRFFAPEKFQLVLGEGEAVRGTLININHGQNKGFYDSFRVVFPEPVPGAEGGDALDKPMLLSVAFVVPESGVNLSELWVQLDGVNPLQVPAPAKPKP